jgi:hypothetical protein
LNVGVLEETHPPRKSPNCNFTLIGKGQMKNKHHNYNSEAKSNTYSDSNWKQLYVSDAVAGSRTVTISFLAIQQS